jgi:hypothetical protein
MNAYGMGSFVTALIRFAVFSVVFLVPLALWKLVEIILWAWARVHWGAP